MRILIYGDDVNVREQVKLALGKRLHPELPELTYINVATAPVVIRPLDAGLKSRFRANFPVRDTQLAGHYHDNDSDDDWQTCIIRLIRNTFRLTSRKYWDEIKRDVKPIYTAVNAAAARTAFEDLTDKWGQRYPAVIRLWNNAWAESIPFLDYEWKYGG